MFVWRLDGGLWSLASQDGTFYAAFRFSYEPGPFAIEPKNVLCTATKLFLPL